MLSRRIHALLDAAVAAGEIAPCDPARLARAVQATYNGSLVTWAIARDGPLADWLGGDLTTVISPYRIQGPN